MIARLQIRRVGFLHLTVRLTGAENTQLLDQQVAAGTQQNHTEHHDKRDEDASFFVSAAVLFLIIVTGYIIMIIIVFIAVFVIVIVHIASPHISKHIKHFITIDLQSQAPAAAFSLQALFGKFCSENTEKSLCPKKQRLSVKVDYFFFADLTRAMEATPQPAAEAANRV